MCGLIVSLFFLMVSAFFVGVQQTSAPVPPSASVIEATPTHTPAVSDLAGSLLGEGTAAPTIVGATFTPDPARDLLPAGTPTPTFGPTLTPGGFGPTPTVTPTILYPTFTPSPAAPQSSFQLHDEVVFTSNFANDHGCDWQGVAGQVLDASGQPLIGTRIIALGEGDRLETESGTASAYGASGWEIQVGNAAREVFFLVAIYDEVRGEFVGGIRVDFPGDCSSNLALLNLVRVF